MKLDDYEQKLLDGWEEVFKKGQLTMWIMLALKDGPKHMADIKAFIDEATNGTLTADDQSMYRALRRYYDVELVDFTTEPGKSGPDRKVYSLTKIGQRVLEEFIARNITSVFFKPQIVNLLNKRSSK
ncbi:MAG TPA: PadR family transcriptional regulator [Candidatus Saccharimonadales bacterium]|nr:PadR family transcriptional regulator [Candidatus Saccharimonadales bacterium]